MALVTRHSIAEGRKYKYTYIHTYIYIYFSHDTDWLTVLARIFPHFAFSRICAACNKSPAAGRWQDRNGRPLHAAIVFYDPLTDHLSSYSLEYSKLVSFISISNVFLFPPFSHWTQLLWATRKTQSPVSFRIFSAQRLCVWTFPKYKLVQVEFSGTKGLKFYKEIRDSQ